MMQAIKYNLTGKTVIFILNIFNNLIIMKECLLAMSTRSMHHYRSLEETCSSPLHTNAFH